FRNECSETLACRAAEFDANRIVREAIPAVAARDLAAQDGSDSAICVSNRKLEFNRLSRFECIFCEFDQKIVECLLEPVILFMYSPSRNAFRHFGHIQDGTEIQLLCLPVIDGFTRIELVAPADHFVYRSEAELSHQFTNFFGDHPEVIHD